MSKEEKLIRLLFTKWIELKSKDDKRKRVNLEQFENANSIRYVLGKSGSGNDILSIEYYSPNRYEVGINLNELINQNKDE